MLVTKNEVKRTSKKLLSVLLAVVMIMSTMSVCFGTISFAAGKDVDVTTLANALKFDSIKNATFTGSANNYSVSDPDGKVLAAVEAYFAVVDAMANKNPTVQKPSTGTSDIAQKGESSDKTYRTYNHINARVKTLLSNAMGSDYTTYKVDAFITGLYTKYSNTFKVAKEVIGIRPEHKHFGTMHILNSKNGTYFLADTLINRHPDTETIIDVARLTEHAVRFFNREPVMAMLSYSNFGSDNCGSPACVHAAVEYLHNNYPDMTVDGEIQVNFAMNRELRDRKYPFTRLFGKDVNTLVFPNLSSANATYQMLQAMNGDDMEIIGPIQMGLNKPIHFTDFESSVRDIVNITAVAVIDAIVAKKICNNIACDVSTGE